MSVVQKFDADTSAVEKALEKVSSKYDALAAKVSEVGKRSKQSTDDTTTSITNYAAGLAKAAGAALSLQTALGLVTQQMEKQKKINEEISRGAITIGQSQSAVGQMIGAVGPGELDAFLGKLREIQKNTAFGSIAQLNLAAADTLSATGGNQQMTLDILRAAAPIMRSDPGNLGTVSAGIADVMGTSGLSAMDATALANTALGQSRMTQLGSFKEVAKAIGGGSSLFGADREDAAKIIAGLFGTMSRASKDPDGATTKTSVIAMLKSLEKFGGEGTFEQRLSTVQRGIADGSISEAKLMEGIDASSFGSVRSLYRNDPALMADLTATINKTRTASREELSNLVAFLEGGTPEIRSITARSRRQANIEGANATTSGYDALATADAFEEYNEIIAQVKTPTPADVVENFGDTIAGFLGSSGDALDASTRSAAENARVRRLAAQSRINYISAGDSPTRDRDLVLLQSAVDALLRIEKQGLAKPPEPKPDPRTAASTQAERD
jgi:hypothetical protein